MTFKKWIKHFIDVDRPIGDLAKEISRDKKFPNLTSKKSDYQKGISYLESLRASRDAILAFKNAWTFYYHEEKDVLDNDED